MAIMKKPHPTPRLLFLWRTLRRGLILTVMWVFASFLWGIATDYNWWKGDSRLIADDYDSWIASESSGFGKHQRSLVNKSHELLRDAVWMHVRPGLYSEYSGTVPPPPQVPLQWRDLVTAANRVRAAHRDVYIFGETRTGWPFPLWRTQWRHDIPDQKSLQAFYMSATAGHAPGFQRGRIAFDWKGGFLTLLASGGAASLLSGAGLLRSRRRAKRLRCIQCAYQLLPDQAMCPECGKVIAPKAS